MSDDALIRVTIRNYQEAVKGKGGSIWWSSASVAWCGNRAASVWLPLSPPPYLELCPHFLVLQPVKERLAVVKDNVFSGCRVGVGPHDPGALRSVAAHLVAAGEAVMLAGRAKVLEDCSADKRIAVAHGCVALGMVIDGRG